jgi:acylphosphatase
MGALARKYYITGQVQGVGYRYFAQNAARDLRVRGWARNLEDGRVEVLGIGTQRQLDNFEGELRVGPPRATVRAIAVEEADAPASGVTGFYIR